jgi:U3 small nucleolar RNA-associated protein 12
VFTLEGHKAEVLSIALSPKGTTLYSTSADRSIREWARTDEIVLLGEEQEKRLEAALDKGIDEVPCAVCLASSVKKKKRTTLLFLLFLQEETGAAAASESGVAGKRTGDSVRAADRLADALEVAREEAAKWTEYAQDMEAARIDYERNVAAGVKVKGPPTLTPPTRNPVLLNATPSQCVLFAVVRLLCRSAWALCCWW